MATQPDRTKGCAAGQPDFYTKRALKEIALFLWLFLKRPFHALPIGGFMSIPMHPLKALTIGNFMSIPKDVEP